MAFGVFVLLVVWGLYDAKDREKRMEEYQERVLQAVEGSTMPTEEKEEVRKVVRGRGSARLPGLKVKARGTVTQSDEQDPPHPEDDR